MNLSEFRSAVQDYLSIPADTESNTSADRAVNIAIKFLNAHRFNKALITYQNVSMVAGLREYTLSSNFKDPRSAEILASGGSFAGRLAYLPFRSSVEDEIASPVEGELYTIRFDLGKMVLGWTPSSDWVSRYPTVRLVYHKRVEELSTTSQSLDAPEEFSGWLVWHARAEFAAVRGNLDHMQAAASRADTIWRQLRKNDVDAFTDWQ